MEFIQEIYEARMTRNSSNQKVLTYTDCCERAYLTMLVLELLRRFPQTAPTAHGYAKSTSGYDSYKHFRMNGTDLYNFVYFITGDNEVLKKLKDPKGALGMRNQTTMPLMNFNRYITRLSQGLAPNMEDQNVFMRVETALRINNTDYKAVRRNIFNFNRLSTPEKQKTVTRLLLASRAKLRSSDIIEHLEKLAAIKDYETRTVKDTEPTVSMPDLPIDQNQLAFYRYLVGAPNLMLTKKFLELAVQGKSIPPQFVKAYFPAIKTIDNIVKGGPAFISMLRALEKRAKQSKR